MRNFKEKNIFCVCSKAKIEQHKSLRYGDEMNHCMEKYIQLSVSVTYTHALTEL